MYGEEATVLAFVMVIYLLILGVWWIGCGIISHTILNRKGHQNVGLYILAWIPLLNFLTIFLAIGLPDALLHRKMDYLLRQMVANGLIPGPQAQQPAGCIPQTGAQAQVENKIAGGIAVFSPIPPNTSSPAYAAPISGTQDNLQVAPTQNPAQMFQAAQTANTASWQPTWQPQTTAAPSPGNSFRPGSPGNNQPS